MKVIASLLLTAAGIACAAALLPPATAKALIPLPAEAPADGQPHPLRLYFATLEEARQHFPLAQSLDDELDLCYLERDWNAPDTGFSPKNSSTITMKAGRFRLNRTLRAKHHLGSRIVGQGYGTVLMGTFSDPTRSVILVDDCSTTTFEHFHVQPTGECDAGIRIANGPQSIVSSSGNRFNDIYVRANQHVMKKGIAIDCRGLGPDANNDIHIFHRASVSSYKVCAFYIWGSQVHAIKFRDCNMTGQGVGMMGVWAEHGGFFDWQGGSGGDHSSWDFLVGSHVSKISIRDWNSEGSKLFVGVSAGTCANLPVLIEGCRFDSSSIGDGAGRFIRVNGPGPITIRNNIFGFDNSPILPSMHLKSWSTCGPHACIVEGNFFRTSRRYKKVYAGTEVEPNEDALVATFNSERVRIGYNLFTDFAGLYQPPWE